MGRRSVHREKLHINNSGYSIVELIIVIAIMAVLMGTVFFSISLVFNANAKACANSIQRSIADCKVTSMGKAQAYMELRRDADNNVYTQMFVWDGTRYVGQDKQKVGTSKVYVGIVKEGDADTAATELTAGGSIAVIKFDRASGSFDATTYPNCARILVRGGHRNYAIDMVRLTGKYTLQGIPAAGP